MKKYSFFGYLAVILGISIHSGCAVVLLGTGAAAGAGTVAYVRGELRTTQEVALEQARAAAHQALADLKLAVTHESADALSAAITARNAEDKRIRIVLKRQTDALTKIHIRVGAFGDQAMSQVILDKMKARYE